MVLGEIYGLIVYGISVDRNLNFSSKIWKIILAILGEKGKIVYSINYGNFLISFIIKSVKSFF